MSERATVKQIKDFFEADGGRKVSMQELKDLKANPKDYDDLANGIGDGSLTY